MQQKMKIESLETEQENVRSHDLDLMSTREMLDILNTEDTLVAIAVRRVLPKIARIVDACAGRLRSGGRLLYVGAGTSGRIAYMDAAECPPTFGVSQELIQVRMAGGKEAVFRAQEAMEDEDAMGIRDVTEWGVAGKDCVIGIASSGRTPYVLSALAKAREAGAFTALICANKVPDEYADVVVCCITGPEVLTGSTRLKAGTSAKMILNMISTSVMIRCGRTYGNHMCYIRSSNGKLSNRIVNTLRQCCGMEQDEAVELLNQAGGSLAVALTMALSGADAEKAQRALEERGGYVREAVKTLMKERI